MWILPTLAKDIQYQNFQLINILAKPNFSHFNSTILLLEHSLSLTVKVRHYLKMWFRSEMNVITSFSFFIVESLSMKEWVKMSFFT